MIGRPDERQRRGCVRVPDDEVPGFLACGWSLIPEELYATSGFQTLRPPAQLLGEAS